MRMMMLCATCILLAACAQKPPVIEPVKVDVPVAVACDPVLPAEPEWNLEHLATGATETEKLKAILADNTLSRSYNEELKAELLACE